MALPLPRVVADVGPGGPYVTAARGWNALRSDQLENQIKSIQAQYAPLTTQAEAASKLAYSNLMAPQFLAKMMANPDIVANLPEDQRRMMLNMVYQSGMGQRTGNAMLGGMSQGQSGSVPGQVSPQKPNPFMQLLRNVAPGLSDIVGGVGNIFGGEGQPPSVFQQPLPQQTQAQTIPQMQQVPPMRPGEYAVVQPDGTLSQPAQALQQTPVPQTPKNETYFERAGREEGIKEAGKEAGKIRSGDIKELNDIAFNSNTMQGTLDQLSNIVNTPEFREIRQIPIAGQHEIGWYAKFGTPAQKRMIGQFLSEQGQVVVNAAGQFKGAFRKGEQGLINTMKVNSSDMPEVASGKIQAMSLMNQMLSRRSALTARLMEDQNMSKGKAMEIADKQVNGENIRDQIDNSIKISIRNKKTGERKTISLSEARKLGVPNV